MRRRQIYAMQVAGPDMPEVPAIEAPKFPEAPKPSYKAGICPFCLKDIKKGMYMHIRMHEKNGDQRQR